ARALGRGRGARERLRARREGPGRVPEAGALAPRLPQCARAAPDAVRPVAAGGALGERDRRADLRVARPPPALPRFDPLEGLPGDPGAVTALGGGDLARHARLRHRRGGGGSAGPRRDGLLSARRTWIARLPGTGRVALAVVVLLWIVAACTPL